MPTMILCPLRREAVSEIRLTAPAAIQGWCVPPAVEIHSSSSLSDATKESNPLRPRTPRRSVPTSKVSISSIVMG